MKLLKKCLVAFVAVCLVFVLASCGRIRWNTEGITSNTDISDIISEIPEKAGDMGYSGSPSRSDGMGYEGESIGGGYEEAFGTEPGDPLSQEQINLSAGLITAAAWNENLHYDFWRSLFADKQSEEDNGKFLDFYKNNRWGFNSTQRVTVTVKQGEEPVCGATVTCIDANGEERFVAKTGADGIAYLFPEASEGTLQITSGEFSTEIPFENATEEIEVQLDGAEAKENTIKLMLVIDVTGSMGDELLYLQTELADVIDRIAEANSGVTIDLALLFYRDNGDAEKFAYYDFANVNTSEGMNIQLNHLRAQFADGGGDYPEAVDEALELAMSKAWGDDTSTKIIFHLLDAPPHSNDEDPQANYEQRFEAAVRQAAGMGIRLCPILCSGADLLCEYLMRQAAIYTSGTFIFVTDDSGIGGEHIDPNIPDAVVEQLNDLMVRVVDGYHTGTFDDPIPWSGTPQTEPEPIIIEEDVEEVVEEEIVEEEVVVEETGEEDEMK